MDRKERKQCREFISGHVAVKGARLTDDQAAFLCDFIKGYDENYRGQTKTRRSSHDGWSSDGKYTRTEEVTYTFTDKPGIRVEHSYHDDDGQTGSSSREIEDARGILDWFKDHQ